MIKVTMTSQSSPLTSALYPASMEAEVITNLESQGYTILMVENLG